MDISNKLKIANVNGKKAQIMGMPFQMIFSLILIAVFIFAAIKGVNYFIGTSEHAKINTFIVELGSKVENAYLATGDISQNYEFSLPSRINAVCFANPPLSKNMLSSKNITACSEFEYYLTAFNSKNMNMFFCPPKKAADVDAPIYARIDCKGKDCLDFESPYCIRNTNGKIKINLEKNLGEDKVRLK